MIASMRKTSSNCGSESLSITNHLFSADSLFKLSIPYASVDPPDKVVNVMSEHVCRTSVSTPSSIFPKRGIRVSTILHHLCLESTTTKDLSQHLIHTTHALPHLPQQDANPHRAYRSTRTFVSRSLTIPPSKTHVQRTLDTAKEVTHPFHLKR